ncbi:hypothetical protein ACFFX0_33345 [Citricoccus parietis]|uniref:Uncharacterized protein n=1 Tax=Citricoccus parietis TaxID=592307 RepID=A0ABV5G9Y1_9MICC
MPLGARHAFSMSRVAFASVRLARLTHWITVLRGCQSSKCSIPTMSRPRSLPV